MYEVDYSLVIKIQGQTCMENVPNFNSILDEIFPGGWVGDIVHTSGNLQYHHVEPGVTKHVLDLSKKTPDEIKAQLEEESK